VKNNSQFPVLRVFALIILAIGAVGSFYLTLKNDRNTVSSFLDVLFLLWVLSPFAALYIASVISKKWSDITRKSIYFLMLVVTPFSLFSYWGALQMSGKKPDLIYLICLFAIK
jgi:uncharacterized membrane protein YhaH (DUF805 family)